MLLQHSWQHYVSVIHTLTIKFRHLGEEHK